MAKKKRVLNNSTSSCVSKLCRGVISLGIIGIIGLLADILGIYSFFKPTDKENSKTGIERRKPFVKTSKLEFSLMNPQYNQFDAVVTLINTGNENAVNFSCKMMLFKIREGGQVETHQIAQSNLDENFIVPPSVPYTVHLGVNFEKHRNNKTSFYLGLIYYYFDAAGSWRISEDYFLVHHFPFKTFEYTFLNKGEEAIVKKYVKENDLQ